MKSVCKRTSWNSGTGIKKYCIDCKILLPISSRYLPVTRCRKCYYINRNTNFVAHPNSLKALKPKSAEWLREHKIHLGYKHSLDSLKKMSKNRKGKMLAENNFQWKGNEVGYHALHSWVQRRLGKPDTCEFCGTSGLTGHEINWANKSGEYKRDLTDWLRLCVSCHMNYDGTAYTIWQTRRML